MIDWVIYCQTILRLIDWLIDRLHACSFNWLIDWFDDNCCYLHSFRVSDPEDVGIIFRDKLKTFQSIEISDLRCFYRAVLWVCSLLAFLPSRCIKLCRRILFRQPVEQSVMDIIPILEAVQFEFLEKTILLTCSDGLTSETTPAISAILAFRLSTQSNGRSTTSNSSSVFVNYSPQKSRFWRDDFNRNSSKQYLAYSGGHFDQGRPGDEQRFAGRTENWQLNHTTNPSINQSINGGSRSVYLQFRCRTLRKSLHRQRYSQIPNHEIGRNFAPFLSEIKPKIFITARFTKLKGE